VKSGENSSLSVMYFFTYY